MHRGSRSDVNFLTDGRDRLPNKDESMVSKQKGCWAAPRANADHHGQMRV